MPMFYLDDKHRRGEPFLIHNEACLFRRENAALLGEHAWASRALEAALVHRRRVARCRLCCPAPPINPKKPRPTKLDRLAAKVRLAHGPSTRWP